MSIPNNGGYGGGSGLFRHGNLHELDGAGVYCLRENGHHPPPRLVDLRVILRVFLFFFDFILSHYIIKFIF